MKVIWRIREFVRVHVTVRLRTQRTRALEAEVARLRAENHALRNSIRGIAGIPLGLEARGWRREATEKANADSSSRPGKRATSRNDNAEGESDSLTAAVVESSGCSASFVRTSKPRPHETASIAPLRRRSWQQIERAFEVKDARAARFERESDTDAFPAPRNVVPRV